MASFYCVYSQTSGAQTPEVILASFSYQLLRQLDSVPVEVDSIYQRHRRENTRPDLSGHMEILRHISPQFSKVWLLVDALDELDRDCRNDLTEAIETLMTFTKILITSRPQSIDSEDLESKTLRCTISAQSEDLKTFIERRLDRATRGIRQSPGWKHFVSDAQEKLVRLADEMFLVVSLQLDLLLGLQTVLEMRRALESIPTTLDDFYRATLDRIKAGKSNKPLQILAWLVKFPLPLTTRELREALAVEDSTTSINQDAYVPEDDIVPMCCGLVVLHEDHLFRPNTLSLAHATVHEYLSKNLEIVHGFDRVIEKTCVAYEKLVEHSNLSRPGEYKGDVLNENAFSGHASYYLLLHSQESKELLARESKRMFDMVLKVVEKLCEIHDTIGAEQESPGQRAKNSQTYTLGKPCPANEPSSTSLQAS